LDNSNEKKNENIPEVQYYSDGNFGDDKNVASKPPVQKKKLPAWAKALIIIAAVIAGVVLLTSGCNSMLDSLKEEFSFSEPGNEVVTDFGHEYIGALYVEGEISEGTVGTYNHTYLLNSVDAMIEDPENKGMIIYVNTPGGSVFASDELYLKIREYQETTGRPVYSSMQSQATSGGYYISASADKILANRNCWTGSIGVTMGTFLDVSELLENLGIRTETITSGDNKAMGGSYEPMTDEQKEIFQSLIDEAYDQFVTIVAEGRKMDEAKVRRLADGRIYTAQQAVSNGLIDQIATFEEAIDDMKAAYDLGNCTVETFRAETSTDLFSLLGEAAAGGAVDADLIEQLMELDGKVQLSYICEVRK